MFKNYIKIALRNLYKQKMYSAINVMGLSIGLASCLLITMYILFELSYDRYHVHADRMYRVWREFNNPDGSVNLRLGPIAPKFAPLLKEDFSEFEYITRFIPDNGILLGRNNRYFTEENFLWADEHFFDVFTATWIAGDIRTALKEPNSLVLTSSMAKKYFGDENPVGQSLIHEKETTLKVTGVVEDPPMNSHFHYEFLGSFASLNPGFLDSWGSNNYSTYVILKEGESPEAVEKKIPEFLDRHMPDRQGIRPHQYTKLHMQPVTSIHLYSHLNSEIGENSDITYIYVLTAVALFVLFIACINYVNLATARSARRAKEVGMRKVLGAERTQLIRQFVGESVLITFMAMALAVVLVELALPFFNAFVGRSLNLQYFINPWSIPVFLLMTCFIGIVTGSYPAIYLTRFRPITIVQSAKIHSGTRSPLRASLVVLQFSVSIILMISMGVVHNQMEFIREKDLGFNKEQLLVLPSSQEIISNLETFKGKLLQNSDIVSVSAAKRIPSDRLLDAGDAQIIRNEKAEDVTFRISSLNVDHDYIPTFGMPMAAGRNFQKSLASDSTKAFIINEMAAKMLGWVSADEAIGQPFKYSGRDGYIVGVIKDFHFESLHQQIAPMVMRISTSSLNKITVRVRPDNMPNTIAYLQSVWQQYRPDYPFEYVFVDEKFDRLYRSEQKLGDLFGFFAGLSIFIACLGLLGLAAFMTEQRTKEIGIRKVLGASVGNIVAMVSGEFIKFVLIASVVAWLVSYYSMNEWLRIFAYHTNVNLTTFLLASLAALVIALATVGFQAAKAATANPVESLKYE